jgi:hypothetical protein
MLYKTKYRILKKLDKLKLFEYGGMIWKFQYNSFLELQISFNIIVIIIIFSFLILKSFLLIDYNAFHLSFPLNIHR